MIENRQFVFVLFCKGTVFVFLFGFLTRCFVISWLCVVVSGFVIVIDCNFVHLCLVGSSAFVFVGRILMFAGVWPDPLALCLCLVVSSLCVCT